MDAPNPPAEPDGQNPHRILSAGQRGGRAPGWPVPRLHHLLFLAFTLVAAVPIAILAIWAGQTAFQNELNAVRERHLLIARGMTATLSRYADDLKTAFTLTTASGTIASPPPGLANLLGSLNVVSLSVLNNDGSVDSTFPGLGGVGAQGMIMRERLAELRALMAEAPNQPVLTRLFHDPSGRPVFYILRTMPGDRLAVGVVNPGYLTTLQQGVAFGEHGHAVITDAKGMVIAHPMKEWVAASRDLSNIPVVAAMMRGETGVGQFYSPMFNDMMVAGYAVVPETGWGVMVPQPISELKRRAEVVDHLAFAIAIVAFGVAALLSYMFAIWLSRPVRRVAATAEAVVHGQEDIPAPVFGRLTPSEIQGLGRAFATMLSELRRRATEATQALKEAETSNRAKTRFLANMSHELRTPLNGVLGMLELLKLSGLSRTQTGYIEQANESARILLRVVNDVLDLSELEVGGIELKQAPFRLDIVLDSIREQFAQQAAAKGLNLAISLPPPLRVTLLGDARRVSQMIGNLVDNAIKFTSSGGVAVRVSATDDQRTSVRIRFEVGDTGAGIAPEEQEKIFEAFAQGDTSTTRRHGGSGLGLAIVKELAQRMNGTCGIQSILGVGSTFWISLPFQKSTAVPSGRAEAPPDTATWRLPPAPPQPAIIAPAIIETPAIADADEPPKPRDEPARPAPATTAIGQRFQATLIGMGRTAAKILLVEDNPANARVTKALLETLGCTVITAVNGVEAVAAYLREPYDLVLMDCQMPEMDGYQATRIIRRHEQQLGRVTPIIALTAHAMDGTREECLAAGMDDQLSKPLALTALTAKLAEWLALPARPVSP